MDKICENCRFFTEKKKDYGYFLTIGFCEKEKINARLPFFISVAGNKQNNEKFNCFEGKKD